MNLLLAKHELEEKGFSIIESIYTTTELDSIISIIQDINPDALNSSKTKELFAIRQLLINAPELNKILFNKRLRAIINSIENKGVFLTKAIYFDKPNQSNWFVPFHQDISISTHNKVEVEGYKNWTLKKNKYGVQPPVEILENSFTIRIHLDNTTKENGALMILPKTHQQGIVRSDSSSIEKENFIYCPIKHGGIMLMKPLLFHASNRTTNHKKRRVIHLEFSNQELIKPIQWLEKLYF